MPIVVLPTKSFFGRGLSYPMRLDVTGTRPVITQDDELVLESMEQILQTGIGERPFLVKNGVPYGTRIKGAVFSDEATAISIVTFECKRALDLWEPRIIVRNVDAVAQPQADGGSAIIGDIAFTFRSTTRDDNFVIPFRISRAA